MRRGTHHRCLVSLLLLACLCLAGAFRAEAQEVGARCARLSPKGARAKKAVSSEKGKSDATARAVQAASETGPIIAARATRNLIDASIADDPALDRMLEPYRAKVRELDAPIGRLEGALVKGRIVGGTMGNFVTDAMRAESEKRLGKTPALAVLNRDGMRRNIIPPGQLTARNIFEILPFENKLMAIDLTGAQLRRLLETMIGERDLAESGARIKYRINEQGRYESVSVQLIGPGGALEEIDPARTYTVVTVDFIIHRGGVYSFLREIQNARPLEITIRDALTEHVKALTAAGQTIKATDDARIEGPGMQESDIT